MLAALEALPPVEALRFSRWSYAAVNAGHVLGIALLVGGAVPLSLRLLGFFPSVPLAGLVRILAGTAGAGLALALLTGILLFATRAAEYAGHPLFPVKLAFVGIGAASAIQIHWRYGRDLSTAPKRDLRRAGAVSCLSWIAALAMGRLLAFVDID